MKFRSQLTNTDLKFDLTPLIDVVFQLLIFFLLTASFMGGAERALSVMLPKAVTATPGVAGAGIDTDPVVTITADSKMWLAGEPLPAAALLEHLRRRPVKNKLTIQGDRRARLGALVEVWDAARQAGFTEVHVATDETSEETQT